MLLHVWDIPSHHERTRAKRNRHYEETARRQDDQILAWFKANPGAHTPSEVWRAIGVSWPLTSVRRAISNLTSRGALRMTEERRTGLFDRPEHTWTAVQQQETTAP